jgi:hypothetical protein
MAFSPDPDAARFGYLILENLNNHNGPWREYVSEATIERFRQKIAATDKKERARWYADFGRTVMTAMALATPEELIEQYRKAAS